ncbi:transporter [Pseudomonas sp. COR18]|uniref:transporter n=1 Tax=Pseudomonas sp. COR18 TaxID=3399680 RepID=UPI003B00380B
MISPLKLLCGIGVIFFYLYETLPALADTLLLKNGDRLSGSIISFSEGLCIFDSHYGSAIRVPATDILAIRSDMPYTLLFASGEKATGQLKITTDDRTLLESTTFGTTPIDLSQLVSLARFQPDRPVTQERANVETSPSRYGEDQPAQPPLDFLTGSTVLLSPGEYELDLGLAYKQSRLQYGLPQAGHFQRSSYSARQLELRPTLRAGLSRNLEAYLGTPLTYSHVQDVSGNAFVRKADAWRLADIALGAQYQIVEEDAHIPAIALSLDINIPTGQKRYNDVFNRWKDPLNNGSGHWSLTPGVAFVRSADPAILFGGIGYQYAFARTLDGYHLKPGWVLKGYAGVGFALNERLSLGSRLAYAYSANLRADHQTIHGSDADPLELSFSAAYRLGDDWVISPEITLGLNDDAGPAALSAHFKRRFN